ncbi:MAG: hypothetical protein R2940_02370 [Syntrophotaleaceae bacterium]
MKRGFVFLIVAALCVTVGRPAHSEITENKGLFHQQIKLFTGDAKDSYLLLFPIEVTQPGRVDFEFKLLNPNEERYQRAVEKSREGRKVEPVFRWSFVDSRFFDQKKPMQPGKFQQWVNEANNYNPMEYLAGDEIRGFVRSAKATLDNIFGKKKKKKEVPVYLHGYSQSVRFPDTPANHISLGRMHHDIDFTELSKTQGMYFLVLENFTNLTPELEVKVSFPGTQHQVDQAFSTPPDLAVTSLKVEGDSVHVEVGNLGKGRIADEVYGKKGTDALTLMLSLNGKSWGGVTLAGLDPEKRLQQGGGMASYTFKVKVPENTEVKAAFKMPKFEDADPKNNEMIYSHNPRKLLILPVRAPNQ